jgi:YD repeat-containing protein
LTVSFASLTTSVCTVSGTTVTIVAAGTCTIQASQAGNGTYAPAPNVNQSFTVAKANQTITFGALAGKTYGNAPFAVNATASSSLAVAFASTTTAVCTVSGTTVTIVAAGTCTIQASQAGNGNYNAAPNVNRSFTVAKANQTITFGALSGKTYGAAPFTVSATASSGLAVTFSSTTTAVCTVSGNTVTIIAGGTCTVRAAQAGNGNYNAAPNVNQSFTVTKANQTITFGALSGKSYGAAPFTVSATASSGLAVTFSSLTTSVCTVSGSTVTIVATGTCTIKATQAGNGGYNAATPVNQSFVVIAAAQTITFAALSNQVWGTAPFTVSATASSGLVVTFAELTTAVCTVSGNQVTLVTTGTCTIEASQAGNANYYPAPNVDQSFTVTPASQTITFNALADQVLGTGPLTVAATASSGLPVTFSSLTVPVCTVSSDQVTLVATGTCIIRASQAGDAYYSAAPNIDQSFVVKAAQTITYGPVADHVFNSGPFTLAATASSGLAVSLASLTASVCTISSTTVTQVAIGTCTIRASQAGNATYAAAPNVDQSFGIVNQTITFWPLSEQTLSAPPFTVSATASSGLPVSLSSLTSAVCTLSGNTVTLIAVGTCTIRAVQPGDANYPAAANVDQSFAVVTTLQGSIQYAYDAAGRLTFVYAPNGEAAQYVYDAAGNITQINRFAATNLSIVQFTPNVGPIGSTVAITGTGFNSTPSLNTVKFNGTVATVTSGNPNQLVVTVPAGATTGPISVTNGANTATSASNFTVGGLPTIFAFTPTSGVAGTSVTISGTNFDPIASRDSVAFVSASTVASTASTTAVSVAVPAGATSGKITLTTPNGSATSPSDFFVPPAPYATSDITATGRVVVDGALTPVNVAAAKIGVIVFDAVAGENLGLGLTGYTSAAINGYYPTISVLKPDGSVLIAAASFYGQIALDLVSLPVTGTYTILVAAGVYNSVSFYLRLSHDITGVLAGPGARATFHTDRVGQRGRYTFSGTAGTMMGVLGGDLLKPDGSLLASIASGNPIPAQVLPTTGTYTVWVKLGGVGTVDIQIGVPDFAISNLSAGFASFNGSVFTIPLSFQLSNVGTLDYTYVNAYPYLSANGVLDSTDAVLMTLGSCCMTAGASYTFNQSVNTSASPGAYTLFVKANGTQSGGFYSPTMPIPEANVANNVQSVSVVLPNGPADLTVSNLVAGQIMARQDGVYYYIPVTFQVNNIGAGAAPATWYDYAYLSTDAVLQDTDQVLFFGMGHYTDLAPGTNYTVSTTYLNSLAIAPGNYTLIVKADGGSAGSGQFSPTGANFVFEANENNNTQSLPITIPTLPDLTVSNLAVQSITGNYVEGYYIAVTFQVNNIGASAAEASWYDSGFFSTGAVLQDSDLHLDSDVLHEVNLASGASYQVSVTYFVSSATPGTYNLFVKTDNGWGPASGPGWVTEVNEANNTQSVTVVLP